MNEKETEIFFQKFRKYKLIQTGILAAFEILFFGVIIAHPSLRTSVYSNPNLFALALVIWFLLLICFFFVYHDLKKMEKVMMNSNALNRLAHLDELTEMPNRYACDQLLKSYEHGPEFANLGVCMLEISNIRDINEEQGRETGDKVVHDFAAMLVKVAKKYGFICRNGGNEYLAVFCNCDSIKMDRFLSDLDAEIASYQVEKEMPVIAYHAAKYMNQEEHVTTFSELAKGAHDRLHGDGV